MAVRNFTGVRKIYTAAKVLQTCALLLALAAPARAQFLGFTSPQTVQKKVLDAVATSQASAVVPNIGQSVHYLVYTTSGTITSLSIRLQGSFDATTWFAISESATDTSSGGVFGHIYVPAVRADLTVAGGGTVTAFYAGTSVTAGPPAGIFQTTSTSTPFPTESFVCNSRANVALTASGNTQIIAAVAGQRIYICSLSISFNAGVDLKIVEGTGSNCATGPTDITGTYKNVLTFDLLWSNTSALRSSVGQAVCVNLAAASTGGGTVIYAQF